MIDKETGEQWHKSFQGLMRKGRVYGQNEDQTAENGASDDEFTAQQALYSEYADKYDDLVHSDYEQYVGFNILADHINKHFSDKSLKILDFGTGTGLLGSRLHDRGFTDIDGSDCNAELLKSAEKMGIFQNLYCGRGTDSLPKERSYDLICSSGVFFLSKSHPCTEVFEDLAKLIKHGGSLLILTKKSYLEQDYVNWELVRKLTDAGVLKKMDTTFVEGYRRAFEYEEDRLGMGAILHYKVVEVEAGAV